MNTRSVPIPSHSIHSRSFIILVRPAFLGGRLLPAQLKSRFSPSFRQPFLAQDHRLLRLYSRSLAVGQFQNTQLSHRRNLRESWHRFAEGPSGPSVGELLSIPRGERGSQTERHFREIQREALEARNQILTKVAVQLIDTGVHPCREDRYIL